MNNENGLNKSLLQLSKYGNRLFSRNLIINALKGFRLTDVYTNYTDVTRHLYTVYTDISQILLGLCLTHFMPSVSFYTP